MSDKRSQANFQIFPFMEGRCLQRLEASQTAGEACRRVDGSAGRRMGVRGSKTAFRHGYNDQEVSMELMMPCKRRYARTPIRRPVSLDRGVLLCGCQDKQSMKWK